MKYEFFFLLSTVCLKNTQVPEHDIIIPERCIIKRVNWQRMQSDKLSAKKLNSNDDNKKRKFCVQECLKTYLTLFECKAVNIDLNHNWCYLMKVYRNDLLVDRDTMVGISMSCVKPRKFLVNFDLTSFLNLNSVNHNVQINEIEQLSL